MSPFLGEVSRVPPRRSTRRRNFLRPPSPPSMQATPREAGGESPPSCVSVSRSDWTAGKPVSLLAPLIPPRSSGQPLPFGPSGRQPLRSLLVGMCSGSGRRRSSLSPTMRPGTGAERGGLMVSEMESQPPSRGPGDGERRLSGSNLCSSSWVSADGFLRRRPSVRDRRGREKRHNEKPSQRNRKLSPTGEECTRKRAADGGLRPKGEKWRAGTHKEIMWDLGLASGHGLGRCLRKKKSAGPGAHCAPERPRLDLRSGCCSLFIR